MGVSLQKSRSLPRKHVGSGSGYMRRIESVQEEADEELVVRVAEGDAAAFECLMVKYLSAIVAYSRRMVGDEGEAEDIAQEALLRFWNNAATFDPDKAKFSTWLYRIAGNLCIDRLRKRKTQGVKEPLEEAADIGIPAEQNYSLESQQLSKRVENALSILPERQRQALILCHYQGLKMKEAGDIMDISVEALESLLARARRKLKKDLEADWKKFLPDQPGGVS